MPENSDFTCKARPHLREVSNQVTPSVVGLCHHIEEKRLNVIVQSLVVQEQFGQKT